jgi:hypothetical protein
MQSAILASVVSVRDVPITSGTIYCYDLLVDILDPCRHMLLDVTRQGNIARCVEIG